jgi:hypothetical protein
MSNVTRLLDAAAAGDSHAAAELLPHVYHELRKLAAARMAGEQPGQTLQATALVHEAYIRLVGGDPDQHWNGRGHFFAAAAEAMRRILVETARRKGRPRRCPTEILAAFVSFPARPYLTSQQKNRTMAWRQASGSRVRGLTPDSAARESADSVNTHPEQLCQTARKWWRHHTRYLRFECEGVKSDPGETATAAQGQFRLRPLREPTALFAFPLLSSLGQSELPRDLATAPFR